MYVTKDVGLLLNYTYFKELAVKAKRVVFAKFLFIFAHINFFYGINLGLFICILDGI